MSDTLDWKIKDWDVLGMSQQVEIKIKIYSPAVIAFVTQWFAENVPRVNQKYTIMSRK